MKGFEYPAETHLTQLQEVLRLLIRMGTLTHLECEELTKGRPSGMITTLRSAVSDLRMDHYWPIPGNPSSHGHGEHAQYRIDWEKLAEKSGIPAADLRRAAVDWVQHWGRRYSVNEFLDFAEAYRPKNPAADPMARLIFKSKSKVKRCDYQGELWA